MEEDSFTFPVTDPRNGTSLWEFVMGKIIPLRGFDYYAIILNNCVILWRGLKIVKRQIVRCYIYY